MKIRGTIIAAIAAMGDAATDDLKDFQKIYTAHHDWVWRLLSRMGVPDAGLDDALQDVFIVVHRRSGDYDGRASLKSWIAGIARRVASGYARTQGRAHRREEAAPPPEDRPGPDDSLILKQAVDLVDDFLAGLSEDQREVFVLAEIEQWTAPEIAAALEVKVGTVYSRLHTARAFFAEASLKWQAAGRGRHDA